MKFISIRRLRANLCLVGLLMVFSAQAIAQNNGADKSLSVVMLSDLHFDPLRDPDKVPMLADAPVSKWTAILESPASATQTPRFEMLQKACSGKESTDSPYALLRSSLTAARVQVQSAAFVMVSGDLLVHDLDCRYRAALGMPPTTKDDQSASAEFAEKTTVFVMQEIELAFPGIPVYLALGNNDSRCNHNRLDARDAYLEASVHAVMEGLRGVSAAEKIEAAKTYRSAGYYSVKMAAPMRNTRLIVIDDIYMMPKYATCEADGTNHAGEQEQITWLQTQLEKARAAHERVWVMGHLPPVVNPDASLSGKKPLCDGGKVVRYQVTDDLANQLTANADEIKLGIFGHTHMDEVHLLRGDRGGVPIKVVGSVSPVSGNLPSFTVGTVETTEATLTDYTVFEGSNASGTGTQWKKEYSFDLAYDEAAFSPASLSDLIVRLRADPTGTGKDSRAYQTHFFKGGTDAKKLSPSWPAYVCSMDNVTGKSFSQCVCESH
jgi:sphingomyelin phosphodiesterase acid-like 3